MLQRSTLIRSMVLLGAAAALAGCAGMMGGKSANTVNLSAHLSGQHEVPPNTRPGTGMAEARYNKETGILTYKVTYSGLSGPATGAHIHGPASPTANAGIVVPFPNPQSPISGQTKLTDAQATQLLSGLWYVNIHTAAHPPGEIRGQLVQK
jgi:hypothetical protein